MSVRLAVPAVLLAGLVGLAGCVSPPGYGQAPAQPDPAGAQPAPAPPPAAGPAPSPYAGDLRTLLLPVPATATKTGQPNSDGTISINQAAASFENPTQGLTQLKSMGYQRGAIQQWREPDGTDVALIAFQFGDHANASTFTFGAQNSYALNRLFSAPNDIPGVPLGKLYQLNAAGADKQWVTEVFFTKNAMSMELALVGPAKLPLDRPIALAQAQFALLP